MLSNNHTSDQKYEVKLEFSCWTSEFLLHISPTTNKRFLYLILIMMWQMFELGLCFFRALSYEHSDFGNFKRKYQIILFVQESFERVTVQLDTLPCIVYFLYIYSVATYSILHAYFIGPYSQFKRLLEMRNLFLSSIIFHYIVYSVGQVAQSV